MTITATILESNDRSAGCCNGWTITGDLPALSGSEKQVAWAATIRETALKALAAHIGQRSGVDVNGFFDPAEYDAICAKTSETLNKAAALIPTDASWWIDHKHLVGTSGSVWVGYFRSAGK